MLTGDKLETAICIAKSSRLLQRSHNLHVFRSVHTRAEAKAELTALARKTNAALVITGDSLAVSYCFYAFSDGFLVSSVGLGWFAFGEKLRFVILSSFLVLVLGFRQCFAYFRDAITLHSYF